MQKELFDSVQQSIRALEQLKQPKALAFMADVAEALSYCFQIGNKVIIAGNGGSLCDAAHFAEEFTGFFHKPRPPLPVIALSEPGHLTCTANDLGFEWIFSRGVEAYGKPGDIFIGLSTSGNSVNILNAVRIASRLNLKTITFLGKDGGQLKGSADLELIIEGFETSDKIQEAHMTAMHIIISFVEKMVTFPTGKQEARIPAEIL